MVRAKATRTILMYLAVMWVLYIASLFVQLNFGVIPRTVDGLYGVIGAPFLHANFFHIFSNTIGLGTFGFIYVMLEGEEIHFPFWFVAVLSGIGTWIFARQGHHIGASGVIFGLYGYLLSIGFLTKQWKYMIVSLVIAVSYGWMIFGMLPDIFGRVSFEGHLFGFLSGVVLAKLRKWADSR